MQIKQYLLDFSELWKVLKELTKFSDHINNYRPFVHNLLIPKGSKRLASFARSIDFHIFLTLWPTQTNDLTKQPLLCRAT